MDPLTLGVSALIVIAIGVGLVQTAVDGLKSCLTIFFMVVAISWMLSQMTCG